MNRVRFSSEPPYLPGPRARAEQLVTQIAVAVLEVDEGEADVAGQPRGGDEVVDERVELAVGQQPDAASEPAIEDRVAVAVSGAGAS